MADQYKQAVNFNDYGKKKNLIKLLFFAKFIVLVFYPESAEKISAIVCMKNEREDFSRRKNRKY